MMPDVSESAATPSDPGRMRASDSDRERVARVLNAALGEGRLTLGEVDERLVQVYAAKTLGELEPITKDLPEHALALPESMLRLAPNSAPGPSASRRIGGTPGSTVAVAVMSGAIRKGNWVVPQRFQAIAIMGGIDLDLTQAGFATPEVTINAFALMGGVRIVVPDDVTVVVHGFAFMGGFDDRAQQQGPPGSPVVHVTGFAMMGGVEVRRGRRRPPSAELGS